MSFPTDDDVMEAVETLAGLQPSWYREILEVGPVGDEEFTLHGDDVGSLVYAVDVLKRFYGIV